MATACRGVIAMGLALGGCYMDATAGVERTAGGVQGYGWELGLVGGLGWDVGPIRPSAGVAGAMTHTGASDGKFGAQGFAYHGRLDVAISGDDTYTPADLAATHPGIEVTGNVTGRTLLTLDYGRGTETLHFVAPTDPMRYEHPGSVHSFYFGIAREYTTGAMKTAFGIGPHVTYMPNNFVGDTTSTGLQFHVSAWFIPVFRPRKTGSLLEHYTPTESGEQKTRTQDCHTVEECTEGGMFGRSCHSHQVCE